MRFGRAPYERRSETATLDGGTYRGDCPSCLTGTARDNAALVGWRGPCCRGLGDMRGFPLNTMPEQNRRLPWGAGLALPTLALLIAWVLWNAGLTATGVGPAAVLALLGFAHIAELRRRGRAERIARDSIRRYQLLAEHSSDMIVSFDPHTQQRTYVSPSCRRLYGYEPDEARALSAAEIIHPDDFPAVQEALKTLEFGREAPVTYRGRRKDGNYIWVEASLTPSINPETEAPEIVSVVRDVSERVRYETALRQAKEQADSANRAKSEFLSTMSHELRTPLNAVIGFSDLMRQETMGRIDHEKYRSYITDIHTSGMLLLNLINEILDLSKAEAGKLELNEETFDIGESVRAVARLMEPAIRRAELCAEIDISSSLPLLRADERKTQQVLFNLLSNAIKFTPPGGHISVFARFDPQSGLSLGVRDTGIGIAPENLDRVFEPFVQVDSQLNRQHQGTGLGLAIVKAVMELHQGAVELKSIKGNGTEVTVIFPPDRLNALYPLSEQDFNCSPFEPQNADAGGQ
jgi:PAS domain S-box-containing protein